MTLLFCFSGCSAKNKKATADSDDNQKQINVEGSSEEEKAQSKASKTATTFDKSNNYISKKEGTKYYLNNNAVVDVSKYEMLSDDTAPVKQCKNRLFLYKEDNKNVCYVYKGPVKKIVKIENYKNQGTEITGLVASATATNMQIQDESVYNISPNCTIYIQGQGTKNYSECINDFKKDTLVKVLIVNDSIASILLID